MLLDTRNNVFQVFAELKKVPFAVSRWNWADSDYAIVTQVVPKGDYGVAYAFTVREGVPNDHFSYDRRWRENMTMPNAGSYQWRVIDIPDAQLEQFVRIFHSVIAPHFEFGASSDEPSEQFL